MLRDIRKQYEFSALKEEEADTNPLLQFEKWLTEAIASNEQEPTAMILSTVDKQLQPQSRVVLLKDFGADGLVFYTNYHSNKAIEINHNPGVAALFYWESLERQVRIAGKAAKIPEQVSDEYFSSRPADSRLGAWASEQSTVIPSANYLQQQLAYYQQLFGENIPRPPHWGGYLIRPESFEFWQGRPDRLHDRLLYRKDDDGVWLIQRLAP